MDVLKPVCVCVCVCLGGHWTTELIFQKRIYDVVAHLSFDNTSVDKIIRVITSSYHLKNFMQ